MATLPGMVTGATLGYNPSSPNYANDTFAAITRQQWQDYVSNFVPIENQLIKYATDPTQPAQAMQSASQGVQQAFAQQPGIQARQFAALGVTPGADETAADNRQTGLQRSLADVQAQNTARDLTKQRQESILGSPAPQGI
jgi:hypothetical protein